MYAIPILSAQNYCVLFLLYWAWKDDTIPLYDSG